MDKGKSIQEINDKRTSYQIVPKTRSIVSVARPEDCAGCKVCELICSLYHTGRCGSSQALIHVFKDIFRGKYVPFTCRQCVDPECMADCPVEGALYFDSRIGAIVVDEEKCIGCRKCEQACPYNRQGVVIRYFPEENICRKCDLCGGSPKCVEWCPLDVLELRRVG